MPAFARHELSCEDRRALAREHFFAARFREERYAAITARGRSAAHEGSSSVRVNRERSSNLIVREALKNVGASA